MILKITEKSEIRSSNRSKDKTLVPMPLISLITFWCIVPATLSVGGSAMRRNAIRSVIVNIVPSVVGIISGHPYVAG